MRSVPVETAPFVMTLLASFGITDLSLPMAAALSGRSLKAFRTMIARGSIHVTGRVQRRVAVADLEAALGRTIDAAEFLTELGRQQHRHHLSSTSNTSDRVGSPHNGAVENPDNDPTRPAA
jgi:hypothetical protein